jgi:hypothetical protein
MDTTEQPSRYVFLTKDETPQNVQHMSIWKHTFPLRTIAWLLIIEQDSTSFILLLLVLYTDSTWILTL